MKDESERLQAEVSACIALRDARERSLLVQQALRSRTITWTFMESTLYLGALVFLGSWGWANPEAVPVIAMIVSLLVICSLQTERLRLDRRIDALIALLDIEKARKP